MIGSVVDERSFPTDNTNLSNLSANQYKDGGIIHDNFNIKIID